MAPPGTQTTSLVLVSSLRAGVVSGCVVVGREGEVVYSREGKVEWRLGMFLGRGRGTGGY